MNTQDANGPQVSKSAPKKRLGKTLCLLVLILACWSIYCQSAIKARLSVIEQFIKDVSKMHDHQGESITTISTSRQSAQRALELAEEAKAAGRIDLAMIYHVNALTHEPSETKNLTACAEFVFSSKTTDSIIERLRSITQVVMYQIPPEDIPKALAILEKCGNIKAESVVFSEEVGSNTTIEEQLSHIEATPIDEVVSDPEKLRERIQSLASIADSLPSSTPISKELEDRVAATLKQAEQTLVAVNAASLLDKYFSNLALTLEKDTVKSLSIVQTAEASISQFWGLDLQMLPKSLQERINAYPTKLKESVDKIAEVKSRPLLELVKTQANQAKQALNTARLSSSPKIRVPGPIQTACAVYEDCFTHAQHSYSQIVSEPMRKEADVSLKYS